MAADSEIIISERLLTRFIQDQRNKNISLVERGFAVSHEDAEDIYQEACLALYRNIQRGKLVDLTSRLSTYFTQICVVQAMKMIRDSKVKVSLGDNQYDPERIAELMDDADYTPQQQMAMMEMVKNMPEPCRTILWQFHYENKSMAEIAGMIGFGGADSVKAKKSQCLSKLKSSFDYIIEHLRNGED